MSRYTPDSRDRVRDAVDMVRLVEAKVELRKSGHDSYFGCCPFHDERTASFHVRPDEKHYHCFGCSESGDPFDFVMQTEGLDFKGALESLADRFGVTLETIDEDPEAAARRARRERLYSLLTRTATFYERMLWESPQGAAARDYLTGERGLDPEVLRRFRVGWAPNAWDRVLLGSRSAGFSDEEMLDAGLIQRSRENGAKLYDRFRAQIMFPTADARGRVIGFGARKPPGDDRDWLAKYINTREGDLYSKRAVLYGIDEARGPAAKADRMVLAEGYTDVIALQQAGIANAVGIMGTSLTKEQVAEMVKLVHVLELCLDADNAGQQAMARAAALCAETGLELRVVPLPTGADPGELIKTGGPEALAQTVSTSVPYVVFAVERILARADLDSAEGKDRAIAELAPALAATPESVLLHDLRRRIAEALGIAESLLVTLLEAHGSGGGRGGPPPSRDADPGPAWEPAPYEDAPYDDGGYDPGAQGWDGPGAGSGSGTRAGSGGRPGANGRGGSGTGWRERGSGGRDRGGYGRERGAYGRDGRGFDRDRDRPPLRPTPLVRGGGEQVIRTESDYLAVCLASGEMGMRELAQIDPDALLTSAILRRVVRRLTGQMEISPGVVAIAPEDPTFGVEISEEQVSRAMADLEARAARAAEAGRSYSADQIEHARLVLELARVERDIQRARLTREGMAALTGEREELRKARDVVSARIHDAADSIAGS